ncbi:MAG: hypothetical protein ABSC90_04650 [Acidimicrobiales bacterium]
MPARPSLGGVELRYLYLGSPDTESDAARWLAVPGARLRWRFQHFGADVAAIDTGSRPLLLIADHRPAGSVLPVYAVDDLDAARLGLQTGGWELELGTSGTPEGPACVLRGPGAAAIALLRVDRPDAMEVAYADESNTHRVI